MKKILVVDDEIHIVQVVAIKLRNNGFEVMTADNGQSAYNLAVTEHPDAIITDLQMPGMTGLEMVEKLRSNDSVTDIPIIMLTARGLSIDAQEIESLSIVACLSKPFSPREVLATLETALEPLVA
jgi:two-component system alkaline phosphatase synthesis response regulator PhoP